MVIRLKDLIAQIPTETEAAVTRTRDRFNPTIRGILRRETGLRFSFQGGIEQIEEKDNRAVRVQVTPGVPAELEKMTFTEDMWLAVILTPWKACLESLRMDSFQVSKELCPILMQNEVTKEKFGSHLKTFQRTTEIAEILLKEVGEFDLIEHILAIRKDILGRYSYYIPPQPMLFDMDKPTARIDLYWGVIGLFAKALDVSVEGLTIKVLSHELAHAYTHLGADIDGHRWRSDDFGNSELDLIEGLAQYYTVRVIDRFENRIPDTRDAYIKLLQKQPKEYHTHKQWFEKKYSPEEIRLALIEIRRLGRANLSMFNAALRDAKTRLRK